MRRLTLKHLETIVAVAQSGTIAAAADNLNVTAAALTSRIKLLEDDVGLALFDRTGGRLRLTDAGQEVVNAATRDRPDAGRTEGDARRAQGQACRPRDDWRDLHRSIFRAPADRGVRARKPAHRHLRHRRQPGHNRRRGSRPGGRYRADGQSADRFPGGQRNIRTAPAGRHRAPGPHYGKTRRHKQDRALAARALSCARRAPARAMYMTCFFDGLVMPPPRVHVEIGSNETVKQAVMAGLGLTLISAHTIEAEVAEGRLVILDVDRPADHAPMVRRPSWPAANCRRRRDHVGFHRLGRSRLPAEDRPAEGIEPAPLSRLPLPPPLSSAAPASAAPALCTLAGAVPP